MNGTLILIFPHLLTYLYPSDHLTGLSAQTLRNGVPLSKVWEAAVTVIKAENEAMLPHFTKNCGFATGLGTREILFE